MNNTTTAGAVEGLAAELQPCPFCAQPLFVRRGVNPYGRCETADCWASERKIQVPLDDPRQVAQWNTRPTRAEGVARALWIANGNRSDLWDNDHNDGWGPYMHNAKVEYRERANLFLAALTPSALSGDARVDINYWNEVASRLGHESVCEALEKLDELQSALSGDAGEVPDCDVCELPETVCACEDAAAYDEASHKGAGE